MSLRMPISLAWMAFILAAPLIVCAQPLQVCVTAPELGSLVGEVGGAHVSVTAFVKGTEDPHFVEARPSFVRNLSRADMFVIVGLDQEVGWIPVLLKHARNADVLAGGPGYLDASTAIHPLEVPLSTVDRSMGDVHALGNPHYLLDPVNGVHVARLIRDKLTELRPSAGADFAGNYERFRSRIGVALVGEKLALRYEFEKLALLYQHGKLKEFLESQGRAGQLGGWLARTQPFFGTKAVGDHNIWPYFAERFGLRVIGYLEPRPGVPPTTQHLARLVDTMKADQVKLLLSAAYYDPRHARFVSQKTGARVVQIAHQVGARKGTDTYVKMLEYNVRALVQALEANG